MERSGEPALPCSDREADGDNGEQNTTGRYIATALGLFNVALGAAICWLIASLILQCSPTKIPAGGETLSVLCTEMTVSFLVLTSLGAGLGAVLHNLFGLFVHAEVLGNFQTRFSGSYILGPFAAALLGFGIFLVLQAGLLALGSDAPPSNTLRASLFYTAIGLVTGFAFDTVILRIDAVARQIFGGQGESFIAVALRDARRKLGTDSEAGDKAKADDVDEMDSDR